MIQNIYNTIYYFLPEIVLGISVIILNIITHLRNERLNYRIFLVSFLVALILSLFQINFSSQYLLSGAYTSDSFGTLVRIMFSSSMLIISIIFYSNKSNVNEYKLALLFAIGILQTAAATNLFTMYICIYLIIIPLLLTEPNPKELRIKMYITNGLFLSILLFGLTLFFGLTGSSNYNDISNYLSNNTYNILILLIGIILVTTSIGYFSNLGPFNIIGIALSSKSSIRYNSLNTMAIISFIIILTRFYYTVLNDKMQFTTMINELRFIETINWQLLLIILSAITITVGNLGILWQSELRKIFGFALSIQSGFFLFGIIAYSQQGINAIINLLIIYIINSIGLLIVIKILAEKYKIENKDLLNSFKHRNKFISILLILFLLQFTILPAGGGFISKLLLLIQPWGGNYVGAVIVIIITSISLIIFIFKLSVNIFSNQEDNNIKKQNKLSVGTTEGIILLILTFANILFIFIFHKIAGTIYII